jgi:hypothetical protein
VGEREREGSLHTRVLLISSPHTASVSLSTFSLPKLWFLSLQCPHNGNGKLPSTLHCFSFLGLQDGAKKCVSVLMASHLQLRFQDSLHHVALPISMPLRSELGLFGVWTIHLGISGKTFIRLRGQLFSAIRGRYFQLLSSSVLSCCSKG